MIDPAIIDRLKANLMTSGLSQKDPPLFQVISQLIDALRGLAFEVVGIGGGGGGTVTNVTNIQQFLDLSGNDGSGNGGDILMINSGSGSTPSTPSVYDAPLTDGDVDETDLIFADGECIIVQVPV